LHIIDWEKKGNSSEFQQQVKNRTRIINFREAKRAMYQLYSDHRITFYCGCDLTASHSINLAGCGMPVLGKRIRTEAEHVVPASHFGKKMGCWQRGGREECNKKDVAFQKAEADLVNLVPAVGYINQRRSNYHFGEVLGERRDFGVCDFEISSGRLKLRHGVSCWGLLRGLLCIWSLFMVWV